MVFFRRTMMAIFFGSVVIGRKSSRERLKCPPYRHPREIDDFDGLATSPEPTVRKAQTTIPMREDGDGPRDWQIRSRWGFHRVGPKALFFTELRRKSPSAMATKHEYELVFVGSEWRMRGPGRDEAVSREFVDDLAPKEFTNWLREQEDRNIPWWEQAA
jgi:hypothetical protein